MALILSVLLLVMAIGFLSQRSSQNRAALASQNALQASLLAESGLRDALLKLGKRVEFPPLNHVDQTAFEYRNVLRAPGGEELGSYNVVVDMRYANAPYWIVRVISTGMIGDPSAPTSSYTLHGELDVSEIDRATWGTADEKPNPDRFRWLTVGPPPLVGEGV
jgi:hypothetical protein